MSDQISHWSPPDSDGIKILALDTGAKSTLRGRRRRRCEKADPTSCSLWPQPWRDLLADWLRAGSERRKWSSLLRLAGHRRATLAGQVLEALLRVGLVEVEERLERSRWQTEWIRFVALEQLRARIGLADRDEIQEDWRRLAQTALQTLSLQRARMSLDALPATHALRRMRILIALDQWLITGRFGTRRDFAWNATGDTKGITAAEWRWLEEHVDLASAGVEKHMQAFWLRAPFVLDSVNHALDLNAVPDCIGLTPETIARVTRLTGSVERWQLLENRTSFERAARRYGDQNAVVWLPGYPPPWWEEVMANLLKLCPAPALIACDPDPAGIAIASQACRLWEARGLQWKPWSMSSKHLASLKHRKPLTTVDRQHIGELLKTRLPIEFAELAVWMLSNGEKGEQEGLSDI